MTSYVKSELKSRGGVMLLSPPGQFKTSILVGTIQPLPRSIVASDINMQTLGGMKADIAAGTVTSLVFPELPKIYERHHSSASNVMGCLRAIADEGFSSASYEDSRIQTMIARAAIFAAMPVDFHTRHWTEWKQSGFLRRFLWSMYVISDKSAAQEKISRLEKLDLNRGSLVQYPALDCLDYTVLKNESNKLLSTLRDQDGGPELCWVLAQKILSVLQWSYSGSTGKVTKWGRDQAMDVWEDYAQSLTKHGAVLDIGNLTTKKGTKK